MEPPIPAALPWPILTAMVSVTPVFVVALRVIPAVKADVSPNAAPERAVAAFRVNVGFDLGALPGVSVVLWFWILLAACAKRWHDRDKSGWWALMNLIPIVGTIWVLIECGFLSGTPGRNRFGPDPLAGARSDFGDA